MNKEPLCETGDQQLLAAKSRWACQDCFISSSSGGFNKAMMRESHRFPTVEPGGGWMERINSETVKGQCP